jgi:uncharacterized protein YbaP (TraB family)
MISRSLLRAVARAALLLVALLGVHQVAPAQKKTNASSLLWEISGNGLSAPSYLYGTMHVRDARVFDFADSVLIDFRRCQVLAEEMMLDSVTYWLFNHLDKGDSACDLRSRLTARQYQELDSSMQSRWSVSLDRYPHAKPWMLYTLNSRPARLHNDEPTFLDAYLLHIAKLEGMAVHGLESMEEQEETFNQLAERDVAGFFGFGYFDETGLGRDEMARLYSAGDVERIRATSSKALPARVVDLILTRRNYRMVERIDTLVRRARTFVAIGAAHLGGDEGVIALLRRRGFTLRPVVAVRTGLAKRYVPPTRTLPWINLTDTLNSFAMDVPTPPVELPLNLQIDLKARMLISSDPGTGIGYGLVTMVIPMLGTSSVDGFIDAMLESPWFKKEHTGTVQRTQVTLNGMKGAEASFSGSESQWIRFRVFRGRQRLFCQYVVLDRRWREQPDAERFFSSLRILDAEEPGESARDSMIEVRSARGAVACVMPADTHSMALRVSSGLGDSVDFHLISSTSRDGTAEYMMLYQDVGANRNIADDSLSLALRLSAMAKAFGGIPDLDSTFLIGSFPAREVSAANRHGLRMTLRALLRGDRTYVFGLTAQDLPENASRFARFRESTRMLEPEPPAWHDFSSDTLPLSVRLPGPVDVRTNVLDHDDSIFTWSRSTTVYARDSGSGILYAVDYRRLAPRYRVDDMNALFDDVDDHFSFPGDSTVSSRTFSIGADPAREIVRRRRRSHGPLRMLTVLHGRDVFILTLHAPESEIRSSTADRFFTSFRATGPDTSIGSLFASDLPEVLADIDSGDSTRRAGGLRRLWNDDFGRRDLPVAYEALRRPRPDDSLEYGSVREALIRIVRSQPDSLAVGNLVALLPAVDSLPALRTEVLRGIAMTAEDAGRDSLLAILHRRPGLVMNWHATTLFHDVRMPVLKRWIPSLIVLGEDDRTAQVLLNAAAVVLRRDSLALDPVLPEIRSVARRLIAPVSRHDSAADMSAYVLASLAEALPPGRGNDSLLHALSEMEDLSVATPAVLTLIHHGVVVPESTRERIAASPYWRLQLYYEVDSAHRAAQIPPRYRTQRAFVESFIYDYMSDDVAVDSTVFVADREASTPAGLRRFYLFRVHADSAWRPLVIGPVSLDRSDLRTNEATYWMGDNGFDARLGAKYFDAGIDDIRRSIAKEKDDESGDEPDRDDE